METDKTTISDLVIFDREDEFSVFQKIDLTVTSRGREQLRQNLRSLLNSAGAIQAVQDCVLFIKNKKQHWPAGISNGTVMVVERFYEANIDRVPGTSSVSLSAAYKLSVLNYQFLHSGDFSLVKYSVKHCFDLVKGMQQMLHSFLTDETPLLLKKQLQEAEKILARKELNIILENKESSDLSTARMLQLAHFILYRYRLNILELLHIFGRLDAWYSMALATEKFGLVMPEFSETTEPFIEADALYHILVEDAVSYDLLLDKAHNFLFLTGANMAGKSTFIKACGVAVYLAHAGMGVPAKKMKLSYFDGILSNINVIDNIAKGESYFFNEVQRIKATIEKLNDGRKWLILIDELFKGTNVQDAMKCSSTVIEGLLKIKNAVFILSTHLYEIGDELKKYPNIRFSYFETSVKDDQLSFSYKLKEGVSNDRLGYLILKKEGVVKMLEDL